MKLPGWLRTAPGLSQGHFRHPVLAKAVMWPTQIEGRGDWICYCSRRPCPTARCPQDRGRQGRADPESRCHEALWLLSPCSLA